MSLMSRTSVEETAAGRRYHTAPGRQCLAASAGPALAAKRSGGGRMTTPADVEALTVRYGREIFSRIERTAPVPFGPAWWDDRLMEWSMGNEAVKVQLFRFVDVLPLLHTPASVARHLREYFGEAKGHLPGWLRF